MAKPASKETILLIIVAVIGVAGLIALQVMRRRANAANDEKTLVQSGKDAPTAGAQAAEKHQTIPGNLIHLSDKHPELNKPFIISTQNFGKGPTYEVDPGDGTGRVSIQDGQVRHVYRALKRDLVIALYARYEGEEILLDTLVKTVAQPVKKDEKISPVIDF